MNTMRILDKTGHTTVTWAPDVKEQVEAASDAFARLAQQHYTAYAFKAEGQPGEVIEKFDPHAQRIIMAPQLVGG